MWSAVSVASIICPLPQGGGPTRVTGEVTDLKPPGNHGFHIHEFGDYSSGKYLQPSQLEAAVVAIAVDSDEFSLNAQAIERKEHPGCTYKWELFLQHCLLCKTW